ncbi:MULTISPECIES: hypothetical protein [Paraburkholderia]|uniref:hypothetical protein n=1 Tax=Paraburkholderia TaxID=1822464 RepID=UPI0022598C84|nr:MULTISPECIES: hypothetical protein [Paraburkholderia]MCX4162327.1 hypothetical protein [Paraburkholderia megapolitana]MDN7157822.1 hypothetical protein [Paraburkholderia sp. CHISQ3]MDQ6494869.1 hypothetical protein [Paraburkholderia megapolitana]
MSGMDSLTTLLGRYFGEPEIAAFLADLDITTTPKLKRGDSTAIVSSAELGVEVTFRDSEALDVKAREYPDGALVLANVRLYGVKTDDFTPYTGELPLHVTFGASKQTLIDHIGAPARDNLALRQIRWDFATHCLFAKFGEKDNLVIFSVQLPLA